VDISINYKFWCIFFNRSRCRVQAAVDLTPPLSSKKKNTPFFIVLYRFWKAVPIGEIHIFSTIFFFWISTLHSASFTIDSNRNYLAAIYSYFIQNVWLEKWLSSLSPLPFISSELEAIFNVRVALFWPFILQSRRVAADLSSVYPIGSAIMQS